MAQGLPERNLTARELFFDRILGNKCIWIDMIMLGLIGFFIYPMINLIVIATLDVASKKAIGTAARFIGLFGYIGRTIQAKGIG